MKASWGGWAVGLCALAWTASAEDARSEKKEVDQRLQSQRSALHLLENQKVGVLDVLELVEKLARGSAARAQRVQLELSALSKRIALAEREEQLATEILRERTEQLSPRLRVMYRLKRQNPLEVLLSAADFSSLVRSSRAMTRLLDSDVRLVEEVHRAQVYQVRTVEDLQELRAGLKLRLSTLKDESARAAQQKRDLVELVSLIHAETVQSHRVIRELEQADRELTSVVTDLERGPATSGFAMLRGRLPMPTDGQVEMGFGRVVNPRFNTVTVQKGLDIRAPLGAPVRSVAPGKIVYAGWLRGYGNLVIVEHGEGFHTLFAHLGSFALRVGDPVSPGEVIGEIGDTGSLKGAYLYFELRQNGLAVDPSAWLGVRSENR